MDSILDFWEQITTNPLLFIAIILTFGVILVNGWTDAPNAIATCVVTRCLKPGTAIIMAAVFNFFGVLFMTILNSTVAQTITKMVDFGSDSQKAIIALSAALFAIVSWSILAWLFGIPTSESHALIAGLTGSAIGIQGSFKGVNPDEWSKVVYGIGVSVILGFVLGWCICKLVTKAFQSTNRKRTETFFKKAQIVGAASMAFMHGAQDGQKFMAVVLLCVYMANGATISSDIHIPLWLMLICSLVMATGTAMGGKKIIKSVGMDMVKLEKFQGFSADIAAALSLLICSVFSMPVSTTHAKTTAIMGVGAVKRLSAINIGVVKEMTLTWILTFPGCGFIGYLMTKLFLKIFG